MLIQLAKLLGDYELPNEILDASFENVLADATSEEKTGMNAAVLVGRMRERRGKVRVRG